MFSELILSKPIFDGTDSGGRKLKIKLCELGLFLSYNKELRRRRMRRSTVRQVGCGWGEKGRTL